MARSRVALQCFAAKDGKPFPQASTDKGDSRYSGLPSAGGPGGGLTQRKGSATGNGYYVNSRPSTQLKTPLLNGIDEEEGGRLSSEDVPTLGQEENRLDESSGYRTGKSSQLVEESLSMPANVIIRTSAASTGRRGGEDMEEDDVLGEETKEEPGFNKDQDTQVEVVETEEVVAALVRFCRVSIFLNIWCSIFAAAFFVYVPSAEKPVFGALGGPTFESVEVTK